jgi:hypothetical protein
MHRLLGIFVVALTVAACASSDQRPVAAAQSQNSTVENAPRSNDAAPTPQSADAQRPTATASAVCTTYNNIAPPCMSTWPQGSPNYHGPTPGNTFSDEQQR